MRLKYWKHLKITIALFSFCGGLKFTELIENFFFVNNILEYGIALTNKNNYTQ